MSCSKRIGIFVFYDKDNIVDDYVIYLLKDIRQVLSKLVVISNVKLSKKEASKFNGLADEMLFRDNIGLDAGAFCEYFNNENDIRDYDELVFFNDTFYGPFKSFKIIFSDMEKKYGIDFWGLSKAYNAKDVIEHIQSFFYVYKKNVFNSNAFIDYWKKYDLKKMNSYDDVVCNHEQKFTKYLNDNGFNYDVYVKDTYHDEINNYNHYLWNSSDQIINNNGVFLKKKKLGYDFKKTNYLVDFPDLKKSIENIKKNTNYDVSLIWKYALRIYNLTDIAYAYGIERVVIDNKNSKDNTNDLSILIIVNYVGYLDEIINRTVYIKNRIFVSLNEEIYNYLKDKGIISILIKDDIKEIISILKNNKTKYFMIFNATINTDLDIVDYSKQVNCFDNILNSKSYLNSVLDIFNDKNIGVLYSPEAINYNNFYLNIFWEKDLLEECSKILGDYKPKIDYDHPPVSLSQNLICRSSILKYFNFDNIKDYDLNMFIKILCVCVSYFGTYDGLIPQIVYSPIGIEYRTNTYKYIYKNVCKVIYESDSYAETLNGLLKN